MTELPALPIAPIQWLPCGSRVTCDPAPTGTDRDWLLLIDGGATNVFCTALETEGWEMGGSEITDDVNRLPADARFLSFTRGEDNLIITESPVFYQRFEAATHVAKRLNLLGKSDRISLFQAVLYGNKF